MKRTKWEGRGLDDGTPRQREKIRESGDTEENFYTQRQKRKYLEFTTVTCFR